MATLFSKTAQRGEWWEIGAKLTDPTTKEPCDASSKMVTAVVRDGPLEADDSVTVEELTGVVLNGPGGVVSVGGRIATVGNYYGTFVVGVSGDGPGWPVKERFKLTITDCP